MENDICENCMFLYKRDKRIKLINKYKKYCMYPEMYKEIKTNISKCDYFLPKK